MQGLNEKLEWIQLSIGFLLPEFVLCIGVIILLIISLFKKTEPLVNGIALSFFMLAGSSLVYVWHITDNAVPLFSGMLAHSLFNVYLRMLFDVAAMLTVWLSWKTIGYKKAEYYILITASVLGAHLLVMSTNFVMLFVSLELISLPSYILAAWGFEKRNMEAALKYFLFGSAASAVMLYGISVLYGITLSLNFTSDLFQRAVFLNQSQLFIVATCLVLCGFLFKIVSAPFHAWAPDVYEASPTPVVAFFSVVPKLAGVGILSTFFHSIHLEGNSSIRWHVLLCLIIIVTMMVGNFGALLQKNGKRMMAYSSIAQAGFLMIGIATWKDQGLQFMLFYASAFLLANYLIFYYFQYFEKMSVTNVDHYAGVGKRHTTASTLLLIGLLSLTGLPPTAGFMGKLFIFSSLWETHTTASGTLYLAVLIIGLLNTVVSLFFYLKIPYQSFLKTSASGSTKESAVSENLFGWFLVIMLLILFFLPASLMGWLNRITFA